MVNSQQWLNENYSDKNRLTKIKFRSKELNLEGGLTISNFPNLQKTKITFANTHRGQITQLTIENCPQLTEVNCP
jgi:hypothetical protein